MSSASKSSSSGFPAIMVGEVKANGKLPGLVKAIAWLAILLGTWGLVRSIASLVSISMPEVLQQFLIPPPKPLQSEVDEVVRQTQENLARVTLHYLSYIALLEAGRFLVSLMLLFGGAKTLHATASGRQLLAAGLLMGVLFSLWEGVTSGVVIRSQLDVLDSFRQQIARLAPKVKGKPQGLALIDILIGEVWFVIIAGALISLLKMAFYFASQFYLNQRHIAARFRK